MGSGGPHQVGRHGRFSAVVFGALLLRSISRPRSSQLGAQRQRIEY
jgi:hypothetical protein